MVRVFVHFEEPFSRTLFSRSKKKGNETMSFNTEKLNNIILHYIDLNSVMFSQPLSLFAADI